MYIVLFIFASLLLQASEIKICLSMLVHNQEATIWHSLHSAKGLVDCYSICDMGSTDNTILFIEKFFRETGIPGKIYDCKKGLGLGRSLDYSLFAAKKWIVEQGFSLNDSYLLTLDPDEYVHIGSAFRKDRLKEPSYLLLEKVPHLNQCSYHLRLFRASLPSWEINETQSVKLRTLTILPLADSKTEIVELKNSLEFLNNAVTLDPKNTRHLFYLAESHRSLKHYQEAINWYKACLAETGDSESLWFSKYRIGECYEELGQWADALYWYLESYQHSPDRAEPILKIATYYRLAGKNDLSYIFANHGLKIPFPEDYNLFPFPHFDPTQFNEELSIVAFYTRFKQEGFTAANDLVLQKNVPWFIKDQAYKNMRFYMEPLKNVRWLPIEIDLPYIEEGFDERYHPMNPSILKTKDGYKVICRAVNYTQTGAKHFHTIDAEGIFRTKNFFLDYTPNFQLLSQYEIIEDLPREERTFLVEGLEDCRLIEYQDHFWFTCTTFNTNPTGATQISLCKLEDTPEDGNLYVETLTPLWGPDIHRYEKNWLPFVKDNLLYAVYGYNPFTIYRPNLETGYSETAISYESEYDFSAFRGSAAPIPIDGGYLLLVHEVTLVADQHRCYYHRFLFLDESFHVQKASKPFIFKHFGVEFCNSMTLDTEGENLILAVGIEDREAYLCFMKLKSLRSLLIPI